MATEENLRKSTLATAMAYESDKRADRLTGERCAAMGIKLIPMIAETLGGWGPAAQELFSKMAQATATRTGTPVSVVSNQLYQSLGIQLQRANARAILIRTVGEATTDVSALATMSRSEAALFLLDDIADQSDVVHKQGNSIINRLYW